MKTSLTKSPAEAAEVIKRGGIVAFPTETVYGLGADIFNESAVAKIFEAKMRPGDNPLIAHIHDLGQIYDLTTRLNSNAERLVARFFPGPLTIVVDRSDAVPLIATAGLETIGIRMPKLTVARHFLSECGTPIVAPSANLSGRPSPTTWTAVFEDLNGRIDCILQGDPAEIGIESTVVDCTSPNPVLLRQGAISFEQLRSEIPDMSVFTGSETLAVRSPGLRHRHYSPTAKVVIVSPGKAPLSALQAAYIGLNVPPRPTAFILSRLCLSIDEYAKAVFEFFRECDRQGVQTIYCEKVAEPGIGAALMDRIRRAADG